MDRIKQYAAEIQCALECLHDSGIVYGYLKSQNILLDLSGHISICGFELGQPHTNDHTDAHCAPEIWLGQAYTQSADWWTLGVLLVEMLTIASFDKSWYEENIMSIHTNAQPIVFPAVVPSLAQDICIKLLNRNPEQRLGAEGVADIKSHPFFNGIDWSMVLNREYEPPFKPNDSCYRIDTNPQDLALSSQLMPAEEAEHHGKRAEEMCSMFMGWQMN